MPSMPHTKGHPSQLEAHEYSRDPSGAAQESTPHDLNCQRVLAPIAAGAYSIASALHLRPEVRSSGGRDQTNMRLVTSLAKTGSFHFALTVAQGPMSPKGPLTR